ncbi:MAG: RNA-directed DNA polymerase [Gammaproteobacteria bacterium]|nr:RNA-directed DNA polymerase [Gammaproteobacteria bacterium]
MANPPPVNIAAPGTLTIAHVNANSAKPKQLQLLNLLSKHNISILGITETKLSKAKQLSLTGYNIIRKDRVGQGQRAVGGGVAVAVANPLVSELLDLPLQFSHCEALLIRVQMHDHSWLYFCTIYNPPLSRLDAQFLHFLATNYTNLIIAGDLNAAHTGLGCKHDNFNGTILSQFISTSNLFPLNTLQPLPTHFPYGDHGEPDILDWMLASPRVHAKVCSFEVLEEEGHISDHIATATTLTTAPKLDTPINTQPRYKYKHANWPDFHNSLSQSANSITAQLAASHTPQTIEQLSSQVTQALTDAADNCIPKAGPSTSKWWRWTPGMQHHKSQRNYFRKLHQNTGHPAAKGHMRWHSRQLSKLIAEQKQRDWETFCSRLDSRDPKTVHPTYNTFKHSTLGQTQRKIPTLHANGVTAHTLPEKALLFQNTLQTAHQPAAGMPQFTQRVDARINASPNLYKPLDTAPPPNLNNTALTAEITPEEIKLALKHSKNTAPGHDNIQAILLKHAPYAFLRIMAILYTASLHTGYIPSAWKRSTICMLPKPFKRTSDPTNYRPISLLSTIGKTLERIINHRIRTFLHDAGILAQTQSGFRPKRSTNDQLYRLSQSIALGLNRCMSTLAIFFDIHKAFDAVWHNGLRVKLAQIFPDTMVRWLSNFLDDRQCIINIQGHTAPAFTPCAGVPQGSVLSPTLFSIYVNYIGREDYGEARLSQYADDLALWVTALQFLTQCSFYSHISTA